MVFNPYTGGGQQGMVSPMIPDRGGVQPGIIDRNKGTSRRSASRNNVKGVSRRNKASRNKGRGSIPKMSPAPAITSTQPAPIPTVPMRSESDPFNTNWAVPRNLGNGGYKNGGY